MTNFLIISLIVAVVVLGIIVYMYQRRGKKINQLRFNLETQRLSILLDRQREAVKNAEKDYTDAIDDLNNTSKSNPGEAP